MKRILYIGNFLSKNQTYDAASDVLIKTLIDSGFIIVKTSKIRNKFLRIVDILHSVILNRKETDLVIIDVFSTYNFYMALGAKFLVQIVRLPFIVVLHGGNLPARLQKNPTLCKWLVTDAAALVAPSAYLKSAFEAKGYRVTYIPNMLSIAMYPYKKRTKISPQLLWVRAFDKTYHPQMAIEVLKELGMSYPTATLCMVGPDKDGSMQACKNLVKKYDLIDKVKFTGALTKAAWHQLSLGYDIFINTTNVDNTPVSVMEAMALGLPVVSTNVGGIPYLLTHEKDALLCEPKEVQGMVHQIIRLLETPELAESISLNARQKVEQFDTEKVKMQWVKLLENV